jgi:hypothetical protein
LLFCAVIPGALVSVVSAWLLSIDVPALRRTFAAFENEAGLAREGVTRDAATLVAAEGLQNAYRLNCFAEGAGALLGLILLAVGVHGLCLLPPARAGRPHPQE